MKYPTNQVNYLVFTETYDRLGIIEVVVKITNKVICLHTNKSVTGL